MEKEKRKKNIEDLAKEFEGGCRYGRILRREGTDEHLIVAPGCDDDLMEEFQQAINKDID